MPEETVVLLREYERIKGYRERGYSLSVTDQDRLIELVEMLSLLYEQTQRESGYVE